MDVEEPEGKALEPGLGDGLGDIGGLEGEEGADGGAEVPFDGDAISAGVLWGDFDGLNAPIEDVDESEEAIEGRACAWRDGEDGNKGCAPFADGLGRGDCPGLKSRTRGLAADRALVVRGRKCDVLPAAVEGRDWGPRARDE